MRLLTRVLLVVFTASWWVLPGMGVIDLTVTWDEDWPVVLEAGWGVLFTVGLGAPFLVAAARPSLARAALVQLYVVTVALLIGAALGQEPQTWWIFAMLAIELPVLRTLVAHDRGPTHRNRPLLLLAAAAAPVGLAYAWSMADHNRQSIPHGDITNDVDHFATQGALGLTLVALPVVAGLWAPGRRLLATSTALMAGYLGLVSYSWTGQLGGFDEAWSLATMLWAAAILVAAWWPSRRGRTDDDDDDLARADVPV